MEKRWLTFFVLVLGITLYFQAFVFEKPKPKTESEETATTETPFAESPASTPGVPPTPDSKPKPRADKAVPDITEEEAPLRQVVIETGSYNILFSSRGGVPTSWLITDPKYTLPSHQSPEADEFGADKITDRPDGVEMIDTIENAPDREYPFEVTLKEAYETGGYIDAFNRRNYIEVNQSETENGWQRVEFVSPTLENGLQLIKTYSIPPEGFLSKISLKIVNHSDFTIKFEEDGHGPGIGWSAGIGISEKVSRSIAAMPAAVWLSNGAPVYEKATGLDVGESRNFNGPTTWAGLTDRYFFASLIPNETATAVRLGCKTRNNPDDPANKAPQRQSVEVYQAPATLQPGGSVEYGYDVYVGPKSREILNAQNHDLDQILFHSSWRWFRALCLFFMAMLTWMHGMVPSWGYSIILVTILIRLATQPFVHFGMKANARFMKVQKKLKPELDEIMKKHKDNPQKKNEETWKLYKKHNANPLGMMKGCVWMMVQMPIFIAFYRLLDASIELRGATYWWIQDLSLPDQLFAFPAFFPPFISHFNLLPVVMAGTQILVSKMSMSSSTDPTQKQLALMMPVMFTVIMYNFPSGMVLYWLVSNIWQIGSQYFINRSVKKEDDKPSAPIPQLQEVPGETVETRPRKRRKR
jgi:YidC/Oxa1 family membrane protein insertase